MIGALPRASVTLRNTRSTIAALVSDLQIALDPSLPDDIFDRIEELADCLDNEAAGIDVILNMVSLA